MPQLGPSFLHRPMSGISVSSVAHAAAWLFEGAQATIPKAAREAGAKPKAALYAFDKEQMLKPLGVIKKSWMGEENLTDGEKTDLPLVVALAPSHIFRTTINLPDTARTSLKQTIALRLEEISPIPPETAAIGIGDVKSLSSNRIEVSVAITRKETLQAAMSQAGEKPVLAIGSSPDINGKLAFVFERARARKQKYRDLLIACMAVWAALLLCFGALEARQDQLRAALETHQSELREALRSTRERRELAAQLEELAPDFFTVAAIHDALHAATKVLPDGSMVTEATTNGSTLFVAGYLPEAQHSLPGMRLSPSPYAGFDRFDFTVALKSGENEKAGAP